MSDRLHYHLISALILFVPKENADQSGYAPVPVNAVLTTKSENVTRSDIGKAQQAAQMTLFGQLGSEAVTIQVLNVVITSMTYLGHMTKEEYEAKPEEAPAPAATPTLRMVKADEVFGQ
jgi:hypothetical protein